MRIIRFIDDTGDVHYGHDERGGTASLLTGELLSGCRDAGKRAKIVRRIAPLEVRAVLCIGLNYRAHAIETKAEIPTRPVLFMKNPAAVIGPEDAIVIPPHCMNPPQVDYECELAVVIGSAAKSVSEKEALSHVLGYCVGNDVSARTWQKKLSGGQWVRGKSFDTFCPIGPAIVTADEVPDPQNLRLTTRLNGQVMQDSNTSDMIFPVAKLISELSDGMTLLPGTVIMTGTPSGVGVARDPQVFLKPGDRLELTIESIGTLSNPITG